MLQQTQVATVIPYYQRFLEQFPSVQSLASADQVQVLRTWEGLGYYRRARQLHAAALEIVDKHDSRFPTDYADVIALPGIGRYTAGAILSFSSDQRLPILEANTIRLYSRCIALQEAVEESSSQKTLWAFAEMILPRKSCGNFNQALIELGSEICKPKQPLCSQCPLSNICLTRIAGLQAKIPIKQPKRKAKQVFESAIVIERSGKLLLRQCGEKEWWAGMWDFPRYRATRDARLKLAKLCRLQTGLEIELQEKPIATIKHTVTHHNIQLDCYLANSVRGRLLGGENRRIKNRRVENFCWVSRKDLVDYPLSVTARKITRLIE